MSDLSSPCRGARRPVLSIMVATLDHLRDTRKPSPLHRRLFLRTEQCEPVQKNSTRPARKGAMNTPDTRSVPTSYSPFASGHTLRHDLPTDKHPVTDEIQQALVHYRPEQTAWGAMQGGHGSSCLFVARPSHESCTTHSTYSPTVE